MRVCITSLWQNDERRQLLERCAHILAKTSAHHEIRWIWAVGDSTDNTEEVLRCVTESNPEVTVLRLDTGIEGEDNSSIRRRAGLTACLMWDYLQQEDDIVVMHESDLRSPEDVVDLLLRNPLPCAGWPLIQVGSAPPKFYDIWAYRNMAGHSFSPDMDPPKEPIMVSSFGCVWAAPAAAVKYRALGDEAVLALCKQWRAEGLTLWADPSIVVHQPTELWVKR